MKVDQQNETNPDTRPVRLSRVPSIANMELFHRFQYNR